MLEKIKKNLINIPGKNLNKKYLVLESDDWGTIRTPDRAAFDVLVSKGLVKAKDPFSRYDALETENDLSALFDVLSKYKDANSNPAVITANTVVCNPDFDKIEASGFSEYYFETFTETFKSYPGCAGSFDLIKQGTENKLYHAQFHAREHLNVPMWMDLLRNGNEAFLEAFRLRCFSIDHKKGGNRRNNVMAAYDYYSAESLEFIKASINEGLEIFKNIFSYDSVSAIAPCYVWDSEIENILLQNNVKYLQGSRFQQIPVQNSPKFNRKFHYNGQKNANNQHYLTRNGLFEPSLNTTTDWVDKCMESIEIAFKWKKPAIIGTHRLNFMGSIFQENRDKNLLLLDNLLQQVLKKWPDVEFVSTAQLAGIYENNGIKNGE